LSDKSNLTQGSVGYKLFGLAGPMVFGLIAVLSQSLVDTYFVGKLGTTQLAALSFTFPVSLTFTSLAIGLSAGASSIVSRVIGSGDQRQAKCWVTDGLLFSGVIASVLAVIGLLTVTPLFTVLGASEEALGFIERYMMIWYISMPCLVVGIVGHGAMRANGEGTLPSVIMVGAALINMGMTPVLMLGLWIFPELNIEGVALATLMSRIVLVVVTLALLRWGMNIMVLRLPSWSQWMQASRTIAKLAGPAGAGNMANPIGIAMVTALLAAYGNTTVAAFGVATRIEAFACLPMLAMSSAIGPFAGQNWGAGNLGRIKQALNISALVCAVNSGLLILAFWLFGETIAGLFASDQSVKQEAAVYLLYVSSSLWGYGLVITTAAAFNGIGRSEIGLAYYAIRMLLLYVPLSYGATLIGDQQAVYVAIGVANVLAGLISIGWAFWWLAYYRKHQAKRCSDSDGRSAHRSNVTA